MIETQPAARHAAHPRLDGVASRVPRARAGVGCPTWSARDRDTQRDREAGRAPTSPSGRHRGGGSRRGAGHGHPPGSGGPARRSPKGDTSDPDGGQGGVGGRRARRGRGAAVNDALDALAEAGFHGRARTDCARRGAGPTRTASWSTRIRTPGEPGARRDRGVTIMVGRFNSGLDPEPGATPTPTAGPPAMRVAVLAGGRSSEHEVSLTAAASASARLA